MLKAPLITAVIPTYKRPRMLQRAVRSVLRQSFPDFEILIADNASGEETDAVIQAFMQQDPRVKVLKQTVNRGAVANFQAAFRQVSTPYVCFLPDDDFFAPSFFAESLLPFDTYPDIAFCGGGGLKIDEQYVVSDHLSPPPPPGYYPPPSGLFAYMNSSFGIAFPPLLFKTAILKEIGGFDLRIRNGMDEHAISQCAARHPIYLLTDRIFYFGYQHPHNLSGQIDYPLFLREVEHLYENLQSVPLALDERREIDQFFTKRHHKILSNAYRHFCARHAYVDASKYAQEMFERTHAASWRRKRVQATLYHYLPFLSPLYEKLKACEKRMRGSLKKREKMSERSTTLPPAEVARWKAFAQSLDID